MTAKVGDRIVVESETVGQPTREGQILGIVEGEVGVRYRVRWQDGHETMFTPSGGSARIVPVAKAPARKGSAKKGKKAPASSGKR